MNQRTVLCPICEGAMEVRDRHGVEIDLCPQCRGVWLDRGELDSIIERSGRFLEVPGEDAAVQNSGCRRDDFFRNEFDPAET